MISDSDLYRNARAYYARWACVQPEDLDGRGVTFQIDPIRDEDLSGYSNPTPFYCLVRSESVAIAVGARFARENERVISSIRAGIETLATGEIGVDTVSSALAGCGAVVNGTTNKYYFKFSHPAERKDKAELLTDRHYDDFERLLRAVYPDVKPEGWLEEYYFERLVPGNYAWGFFAGDVLVSATDVPSIPYLPGTIVEPGIKTHPSYRRRGYARIACEALLDSVLPRGLSPVWSCDSRNVASSQLAVVLGFVVFGTVLRVTISD